MIVITILTESIMHPVSFPPPPPHKFTVHNHCFQFLLGIQLSLEKSKTMFMQNLEGNQSAQEKCIMVSVKMASYLLWWKHNLVPSAFSLGNWRKQKMEKHWERGWWRNSCCNTPSR